MKTIQIKSIPFKATLKELQSSTIGYILCCDNTLIKVVTEYLNPLRCEGHANVFITVDKLHYNRRFEKRVSDLHILNFINKFINDAEYRHRYLIESDQTEE